MPKQTFSPGTDTFGTKRRIDAFMFLTSLFAAALLIEILISCVSYRNLQAGLICDEIAGPLIAALSQHYQKFLSSDPQGDSVWMPLIGANCAFFKLSMLADYRNFDRRPPYLVTNKPSL